MRPSGQDPSAVDSRANPPGSHSKKSRRHGQPAPLSHPHGGTNPVRVGQRPEPAPTRNGPAFSRSATIPR